MNRGIIPIREEGKLVGRIVLAPSSSEAEHWGIEAVMEEYRKYRHNNQVKGKSLCYYAAYCEERGKPVDVNAVGLSDHLLALVGDEGLEVINLSETIDRGFERYGHTFYYN